MTKLKVIQSLATLVPPSGPQILHFFFGYVGNLQILHFCYHKTYSTSAFKKNSKVEPIVFFTLIRKQFWRIQRNNSKLFCGPSIWGICSRFNLAHGGIGPGLVEMRISWPWHQSHKKYRRSRTTGLIDMHVNDYVNSTSIKRKFELTAVEENVFAKYLNHCWRRRWSSFTTEKSKANQRQNTT